MNKMRGFRRAPLAVAVVALAISPFAAPTTGDGPLSDTRRAWRGEIERVPAAGFAPALCTRTLAAPELLALADWPLDAHGRTCRRDVAAANGDPGRDAVEDVVGYPPVVPVVVGNLARATPAPPLEALTLAAAVDEGELAGMRGGFELPGGLMMSFGLERLVYINGELTSTIRLNVVELGELVATGAVSPQTAETAQAIQAAQAGQVVPGGQAALPSQEAGSVQVAPSAPAAGPSVQTARSSQTAQASQASPAAPAVPAASRPVELGSTLAVIQSGAGNSVATEVRAAGALGTVIQNSLNDQRLQIVTTVHAKVNSLELLRADRLNQSIRDSLNLR